MNLFRNLAKLAQTLRAKCEFGWFWFDFVFWNTSKHQPARPPCAHFHLRKRTSPDLPNHIQNCVLRLKISFWPIIVCRTFVCLPKTIPKTMLPALPRNRSQILVAVTIQQNRSFLADWILRRNRRQPRRDRRFLCNLSRGRFRFLVFAIVLQAGKNALRLCRLRRWNDDFG